MNSDVESSVAPAQQAQPKNLAEALARLNDALDGLENTIDETLESRNVVRSADEEVQRMAEDRSRLAKELDGAKAHAENLKGANSEVAKRIVGAMEIVRSVLDQSPKP